jgi:choline dehydrogenase-like flavoprotein
VASCFIWPAPKNFSSSGGKVTGVQCVAMDERCVEPTGRRITVKARHYVLAGGGINSPALLLRSEAPDPHKRLGKRTFLHLVNMSAGLFDEVINPFYGAPQSIYSDHFQWLDGATGKMAYKLEVPPLQPGIGDDAARWFRSGECAAHGQPAAHSCHARVVARRLSSGQPRWQRRIAR